MRDRNSFTIRKAKEDDVPVILGFIHELADYEHLSHTVTATEALLRKHLFGEHPVAEVLIGSYDETPVGFALFFQNFSTFLGKPGMYLEDLYVQPDFRENGLGRAMLKHLARIAKQRGYGRFEWSVLDWNEPAITFYTRLGAEVLEEWRICRVTGAPLQRLADS